MSDYPEGKQGWLVCGDDTKATRLWLVGNSRKERSQALRNLHRKFQVGVASVQAVTVPLQSECV